MVAADDEGALLLGTAGQHFAFDTDAPSAVSWCACAAAPGGVSLIDADKPAEAADVGAVESFIIDCVSAR